MERYHELVDLRLTGDIRVEGSFELDRIESRLDALDQEPDRTASFRKQWDRERGELISSIENLLARIKAS
jgi:hypothetical protein